MLTYNFLFYVTNKDMDLGLSIAILFYFPHIIDYEIQKISRALVSSLLLLFLYHGEIFFSTVFYSQECSLLSINCGVFHIFLRDRIS